MFLLETPFERDMYALVSFLLNKATLKRFQDKKCGKSRRDVKERRTDYSES